MAMRPPRSLRSSSADILLMSLPSNRIRPPVNRPTPPRYFITAKATVDLPQPDSPTRPNASPCSSLNETPGTTLISPARVKYEIRAFSSSRTGGIGSIPHADFAQAVGQQVEAHHQRA